MPLTYEVVDVFTDQAFGGNPLAVVFGGEELSTEQMQTIAREFNFSESTFVLPPKNPENTAEVRIFTPTREVPFAGHPNVGTATVLAWRCEVFGKKLSERLLFEEKAGLVPVEILRGDGKPVGAKLTAPQSFMSGAEACPIEVAACLGLKPEQILTSSHKPMIGSVGLEFIIAELKDRAALAQAEPNPVELKTRLGGLMVTPDVHCYVRVDEDGLDIRSRMFAPLDGIVEDPATGSANAALTGLLASLSDVVDGTVTYRIAQGVEMGRPSLLLGEADRKAGQTTAIRIGGRSVLVMRGEILPL